jgi:hypothetical protein
LLIANDHWWKHASLFPHWFTGKLSDFAGLIVAPVSLALLLGARSQRARSACLAFVAIPFSAVKLSAGCATALETALTSLSWKVCPDPTDLCALLVAPLALRIAAGVQPAPGSPLTRAWTPQLMAAAGALACLASGPAPTLAGSSPYLVNLTSKRIVVEVSQAKGSDSDEADPDRACPQIWSLGEHILSQDDFVVQDYFYVEPHGALPLSRCLTRVSVHGLVRAIAADRHGPDRSVSPIVTSQELEDTSLLVLVEGSADAPTLRAGKGTRLIKLLPAGSPAPDSDCPIPPTPQLSISSIGPVASTPRPIADKIDLGGGCFSLLLDPAPGDNTAQCDADQDAGTSGLAAGDDAGAGDKEVVSEHCRLTRQASVELCMPEELLPFKVGDRIHVDPQGQGTRLTGDRAYAVLQFQNAQTVGYSASPSCDGYTRGPDGVLLRPLDLRIDGVLLEVGQPVERGSVTYYLSRAQESVLSASRFFSWLEVHHVAN